MVGAVASSDCANSGNTGIYIIVSSSWRIYVGQSTNLKRRLYEHIRTLRNGTHTNKILQSSFNKYGYLTYNVVEYIDDPALLTEREQHWMDKFQAYGRGMNLTPAAGSSLGCTRTEEQRELISQITTEFWGKEENRKAQSERKKRFHERNPEHLKLMSELTKKRLEERPELCQQHSEYMQQVSRTPEAIEAFKARMEAWQSTQTHEERAARGRKTVETKRALGEEYARQVHLKSRKTKLLNSDGDTLIIFCHSKSRMGTPRLDACVKWVEMDGTQKMKRFSVLRYGLIPAQTMARVFRYKVVERLLRELEEQANL